MKKSLLILTLCGFIASAAPAQQVLTLEQCRQLALKNNVNVKTAQMEVESAKQRSKQAFTNYFPTVSAAGSGFMADKGALGISVLDGMFATSFIKRGMMAGVTAVQPLFAGGQIINGNKLAHVNADVKAEQLRQSEDDAVLNAEQYYWQLIALHEKLKTLDIVERQIDTICRDVQTAVKAGVTMRNDLLEAELKKNSIASSRLQVENGLQVVKMLLAQCIELPADSFSIAPVDLEELPTPDEYKVNHQAALYNTVPYRLLEKNVEASKLQQKLEVGKYLPTLGIGVGYMYYSVADHHLIQLIDKDRSFGIAFASVSIPLSGWWGGSHGIRQKKAQVKIAEYNKQSNSELLLIKMQQLWNELEVAYKQVKISAASVEKATENARLNTDAYHAGTVAMSDLLNAQSLLQQSRDQYTTDFTNYLIKRTQYLQATGRD